MGKCVGVVVWLHCATYTPISYLSPQILYTKMIRENSPTNPESFVRFGSGRCKRGRDPMEIPCCRLMFNCSVYII
jgi:hypothetical protein